VRYGRASMEGIRQREEGELVTVGGRW